MLFGCEFHTALPRRRISRRGSFSVLPGQTGVAASFGPMAKEVDTIAAAMSALVTYSNKYDTFVVRDLVRIIRPSCLIFAKAPIPWSWETYNASSKLRIGFYVADGFIASTPGEFAPAPTSQS